MVKNPKQEFQVKAEEQVKKEVSVVWGTLIVGFLIIRQWIGFEAVFGEIGNAGYVRYFEFIAAPGLILAALNLEPVKKLLECKILVWPGMLSGALYYVHNNVMEDYRLLNSVLESNINFSSWYVFLLVFVSIFPFALLWQYLKNKIISWKIV